MGLWLSVAEARSTKAAAQRTKDKYVDTRSINHKVKVKRAQRVTQA